jgi:hypothetical protein
MHLSKKGNKMIAVETTMNEDFRCLLELESQCEVLSKQRDALMELDDAEITGYQLANLLVKIAKLEERIDEIRKRRVSSVPGQGTVSVREFPQSGRRSAV